MDSIDARKPSGSTPPDGSEASEIDGALMERIRVGHRESLGILLERYWAPLVAYATGITDDPDVGHDVVQKAFIRVWRSRSEWTPTGTVNAYLYQITRNLALNARRDLRLRQKRHEEGGAIELHRPSPRRPDEELEATSLRAEVESALAKLSERRREVFVLSRFHGLSHREIAEALGTSPQTVANQMSAALEELREMLSHHMGQR